MSGLWLVRRFLTVILPFENLVTEFLFSQVNDVTATTDFLSQMPIVFYTFVIRVIILTFGLVCKFNLSLVTTVKLSLLSLLRFLSRRIKDLFVSSIWLR